DPGADGGDGGTPGVGKVGPAVTRVARRMLWRAGWPVRIVLVGVIRLYRVTLGAALGSACRFHPSCSVYAERAVLSVGAVRGSLLALWRILRCSPLSAGGVDLPPLRSPTYDAIIQPP